MSESIAVKDILTAASPLIKTLVDTFITPKLGGLKKKLFLESSEIRIPTEDNFKEYFHRTYKKLAVVNTLVFNNSQRLLTEIYQPLTLVSTNDRHLKEKVIGFPQKISDEFGNILITDTAGMGKSTLMKNIFIDIINRNIGIPLFIELRRLSKQKRLIDEVQEQLNSLDKNFNTNILLELLIEGGFILILDGYDEISIADKDVVTSDIQLFISKAPSNRYFITSRPEKALTSFGNFQEFKIEPLTKNEAFELLRKYDNQGHLSASLIKKLQEKELATIEEFLTNPLLVSLLFTAFEHKQTIPFKKYLFYRQVYDANFETHDLTKGDSYVHDKYSGLEIDDFHRVLRHMGFSTFKLQRIEFTKDELLKVITDSKFFCVGLKFSESDFLSDILKTVPLFTQDGNYFRWSHKSLQEYFAAQFIYLDSKEKQREIIQKIYEHQSLEKFINVLDLYYDMDYKTFRNIVEFNLLNEYSNHSEKNYCHNYNEVSSDQVIRRLELTFLIQPFLFKAYPEKDTNEELSGVKVAKMLQNFQTKNSLGNGGFSGILVNPSLNENVYMIHFENSKNFILELLFNKKSDIVSARKKFDNSFFHRNKVKFEIEKEYDLQQITDSDITVLNQGNNFTITTDYIKTSRMDRVTINHNRALEKLREIAKDLRDEQQADLIMDGF